VDDFTVPAVVWLATADFFAAGAAFFAVAGRLREGACRNNRERRDECRRRENAHPGPASWVPARHCAVTPLQRPDLIP
jgi:hypothetical protein